MEGNAEYDEKEKLSIYEANNMAVTHRAQSKQSDLESELAKQLLKKANISVSIDASISIQFNQT